MGNMNVKVIGKLSRSCQKKISLDKLQRRIAENDSGISSYLQQEKKVVN
jgi:hypothetical protein